MKDLNKHLSREDGRRVYTGKDAPDHTSSGRSKLKQQGDVTTHLLEPPKSKPLPHQMLARMWNSRRSHSQPMGRHRGAATVEGSWRFLTKLTILLPCDPVIAPFGIYLKKLKTCACKNLYTGVYSSFTDSFQNLEAAQVAASG